MEVILNTVRSNQSIEQCLILCLVSWTLYDDYNNNNNVFYIVPQQQLYELLVLLKLAENNNLKINSLNPYIFQFTHTQDSF